MSTQAQARRRDRQGGHEPERDRGRDEQEIDLDPVEQVLLERRASGRGDRCGHGDGVDEVERDRTGDRRAEAEDGHRPERRGVDEVDDPDPGARRGDDLEDVEGELRDRPALQQVRGKGGARECREDPARRENEDEDDEEALIEVVGLRRAVLVEHDRKEPAEKDDRAEHGDHPRRAEAGGAETHDGERGGDRAENRRRRDDSPGRARVSPSRQILRGRSGETSRVRPDSGPLGVTRARSYAPLRGGVALLDAVPHLAARPSAVPGLATGLEAIPGLAGELRVVPGLATPLAGSERVVVTVRGGTPLPHHPRLGNVSTFHWS